MFLRFVIQAIKHRRQRLLLALSALTVAATLATVLFAVYGTIEARVRQEFRSYGANLTATPSTSTTLPLTLLASAREQGAEAAPWLIAQTAINGIPLAIAGFDPAASAPMTTYWHIEGSRELGPNDCLAGQTLAAQFNLKPGSSLPIQPTPCSVKGVLSTGGPEDAQLLLPLAAAAKLANQPEAATRIDIRAPGNRLEPVRDALAAAWPQADIRINRAVADTESTVVLKIRAALLLLTLLILTITTLCVTSNFTEAVLERAREVGIMKALGAAERRIAALFVSESAVVALIASLVGYALGTLAAALIGQQIFGAAAGLNPDWRVFLSVTGVMLFVASLATAISASRIWAIEPARILRGE